MFSCIDQRLSKPSERKLMVNGAILNLSSHTRDTSRKKKRCLVTKIGKDLFTQALKNLMIISITIDEKISFQER